MTIIKEDRNTLRKALMEVNIHPKLTYGKREQNSSSARVAGSILLPFGYDDMDEAELADVVETVTGGSV